VLADKIGRKPVALFSYMGLVMSFSFGALMLGTCQHQVRSNPYILMAGSLFLLLGGGIPVLLVILFAIAVEISTEKEK
jgi:MFS transporter, PCFT/HCP family, solute carrier family 46 (folate transporter), member 1